MSGAVGDDYGLDVETARTEYNACGYEVVRYQKQLDAAIKALVAASEQLGYAQARAEAGGS